MKGVLYIDNDKIGEIDFKVIDEDMGGIGGPFTAYDNYQKYKPTIQQHCDNKGVSNVDDFNYKIFLADNTELRPEGGIGITDLKDFEDIYVESAGLDITTIDKIKNAL